MGKRKQSNNPAALSGSNARVPMGTSAYTLVDDPSAKDFRKGMVRPKGGAGKGGVSEPATAVPRHGVQNRTNGPRMSISVNLPGPVAPEAGLTQGNGRVLPPATPRSVDAFLGGQTDFLR